MTFSTQRAARFALQNRRRALLWKTIARTRYGWILRAQQLVRAQFRGELRRMIAAAKPAETRGRWLDAALDALDAERPRWTALLQRLYAGLSRDFGRIALAQVASGPQPEHKAAALSLTGWIKTQSAQHVTGITDTTRERIRRLIAQEVDEGASMLDIADALKDLYAVRIIPSRALMIARTEVTMASNAVQTLSLIDDPDVPTERTYKSWLSARDDVVREAHRELDGQEVLLDEPFIIDGYELMWPGDDSGGAPASLTINERCSMTYRTERA